MSHSHKTGTSMRSESHLWTSTPYTLTSGLFSARLSVDFGSRARGGQRAADSLELGVQERREPNFGALNSLAVSPTRK